MVRVGLVVFFGLLLRRGCLVVFFWLLVRWWCLVIFGLLWRVIFFLLLWRVFCLRGLLLLDVVVGEIVIVVVVVGFWVEEGVVWIYFVWVCWWCVGWYSVMGIRCWDVVFWYGVILKKRIVWYDELFFLLFGGRGVGGRFWG